MTTKERPILFSGAMVRALLAGTKTQTRRVVKFPHQNPLGNWEPLQWGGPNGGRTSRGETAPAQMAIGHSRTGDILVCPHGEPGERLWVREAWRASKVADELKPSQLVGGSCSPIWFEAQDEVPFHPSEFGKLRPSMFMPRWASRITLEITNVRVERLQDISRGDAMAEGCPFPNMAQGSDPREWYADLWDSINGPGSWAANPWVWALTFRRLP